MKSRETPWARRGGVWVTKFLVTRLETESTSPSSSTFLVTAFPSFLLSCAIEISRCYTRLIVIGGGSHARIILFVRPIYYIFDVFGLTKSWRGNIIEFSCFVYESKYSRSNLDRIFSRNWEIIRQNLFYYSFVSNLCTSGLFTDEYFPIGNDSFQFLERLSSLESGSPLEAGLEVRVRMWKRNVRMYIRR